MTTMIRRLTLISSFDLIFCKKGFNFKKLNEPLLRHFISNNSSAQDHQFLHTQFQLLEPITGFGMTCFFAYGTSLDVMRNHLAF